MAFLQLLVMLAFIQVVIFQEEGRINGSTTSTGFTAVYKVPQLVHVHTKINSFCTEFHFLLVLLRLLIPCMSRIFTSAMS